MTRTEWMKHAKGVVDAIKKEAYERRLRTDHSSDVDVFLFEPAPDDMAKRREQNDVIIRVALNLLVAMVEGLENA